MKSCPFCDIAQKKLDAAVVFETPELVGFLDTHPLFPGHVLLVPKEHYASILDLPATLHAPFFAAIQTLAKAVPQALRAEGSFIALNDKVSQSVPHVHAHIVPRRKGDGLKGFFWPRQK